MVIRKALILSLVTSGTALFVPTGTTMAQGVNAPNPSPPPSSAQGMVFTADDVPLAEGEMIISGPPELMGMQGPPPMIGHPGGPGYPPGAAHPHGHALGAPMAGSADCYGPCDPGYFGIVEALYMQRRGDEGFNLSNAVGLGFDESEWEWAPRITVGRQFDCINGYEFVYAGMLDWTQDRSVDAPALGPTLDTRLIVDPAWGAAVLDPFLDSDSQTQAFRASYDSFEFNRTYNGWDVVRASLGVRGVMYDEEFAYLANGGLDGSGALTQSVDNFLIGVQVGLDMYYPLANRLYIGSRLKGGAYLNLAESDTYLFDDGVLVAGGSDEDEELAGVFEIRSMLGYQITPSISATIGYDIWYMAGIATSFDQLGGVVRPAYGSSIDVDDDVFIHGLTAGVEARF